MRRNIIDLNPWAKAKDARPRMLSAVKYHL